MQSMVDSSTTGVPTSCQTKFRTCARSLGGARESPDPSRQEGRGSPLTRRGSNRCCRCFLVRVCKISEKLGGV